MQLTHPDITRTCKESEIYESLLALDGASVLELGCGKAEHTRAIARSHPGARILAAEVDLIQHTKNLASERPTNLNFGDFGAQAIPLPDAAVDVVLMFKSLHHVPLAVQDQALAEIHRVLKIGGFAYVSEPVFAGEFNDIMRIFNDEEVVRKAAFEALQRAVESGLFEIAAETFFLVPSHYGDFAEFEKKHFQVTHSERSISEAQRAEVQRLFNRHLAPEGVKLVQQIRVDLLRKAH
jgi:ubiquinone/menaquinone biosynthesis C-methylase UbiE